MLGNIIARVLVLTDAFLNLFVTVTNGGPATLSTNCYAMNVVDGTITGCGTALIMSLGGLVNTGLAALNQIMGGVLVE